jgi:hypothetical protein
MAIDDRTCASLLTTNVNHDHKLTKQVCCAFCFQNFYLKKMATLGWKFNIFALKKNIFLKKLKQGEEEYNDDHQQES